MNPSMEPQYGFEKTASPPAYSTDVSKPGLHYRQNVQAPPTQQVVFVNVPTQFGSRPQRMSCPHCRAEIITKVEKVPTGHTHLMAMLCCIFFCLGPCIYCADDCLGAQHSCPNCQAFLGTSNS